MRHVLFAIIFSFRSIAALADDSLDPSFGTWGVAYYPDADDAIPVSMVMDRQSRAISAGTSDAYTTNAAILITRYGPGGEAGGFDSTFGHDGYGRIDTLAGFESYASSLIIDHHERILVGGYVALPLSCGSSSSTPYFVVARLDPTTGQVDDSFGGPFLGASVNFTGSCYSGRLPKIAVDADDRVLVAALFAGSASGVDELRVYRLSTSAENSDGKFDTSFGDGGYAKWAGKGFANDDVAISIDASGRIVVGAVSADGMRILRFLPDGKLDQQFGSDGIASLPSADDNHVTSIAIDQLSRIYASGTTNNRAWLARLSQDGALDGSFANTGMIRPFPPPLSWGAQVFLDLAGRPTLVGSTWDIDGPSISAMVHLNLDGSFNQAYGCNGACIERVGLSSSGAAAGAVDSSGRTVMAIGASDRLGRFPTLLRYDEVFADGFE